MSKSFKHSNKLNAKNHNARTLQMESLENRELLSVVSPFASSDNLTESVSALVSTVDPANVGFLSNTNQDIPLPPQYKAPQLAPAEGGLDVQLVQTAPTMQIAETPLVVELDAPLGQTTPMALAASSNTPSLLLDEDITPASNEDVLVLNQSLNSVANSLDVRIKSNTSNKIDVSWNDVGMETYAVQYRLQNSNDAWTRKVVKEKTSLSISVKPNQEYEVKVIPQGMPEKTEIRTGVIALGKLTTKVVEKTDNSISIQISNNAPIDWIGYVLGIKTQNEKSYAYYDVYKGNNGYNGDLSYSFQGNVLTIKGLSPNTKYNFQLAQMYDMYRPGCNLISPYTSLSAATTGQKVTKIVVNTLDDAVNNDRYTSLREAIQKAADGAVITFAKNLKGQTINLSSTLLINKNITIDASALYDANNDKPGLTLKTIQKDPNYQDTYAIVIYGVKNVTIKGVYFTSSSNISVGGMYIAGVANSVFNVQNCHFSNLNLGCWFDGNAKSAIANIDNCMFSNISSVGLSNRSTGRMNVTNCEFQYCTELAVWNTNNSSLFVNKTDFDHNYRVCANESGASAEFNHCTFQYTTGCIIYSSGSSNTNIYNSLAANNHIDEGWACFWNLEQGHIYIYQSTFAHNYRTFRNDGSEYAFIVQNSVCAKKDHGSASVYYSNCIAFNDAGLDENTFRPKATSPCVDAGTTGCHWSEKDLAGNNRCMGNGVDIGCYEYFPVETKSTTSGKTTIYWGNAETASYTVQYRQNGTEKWTTKTVKNKSELTIPVKNNILYEVLVTPEGDSVNNQIVWAGALTKLGVKTLSKTRNSITFKLTNFVYAERVFKIGIMTPTSLTCSYYDFWHTESEKMGFLTYSFIDDTLTIRGLSSETKYTFLFAQYIDFNRSILEMPAYAMSTFTKVSVTTNK